MSLWTDASGTLIVDESGNLVDCDKCPCDTGCASGSALYKIKYAEKDTTCTSGSANEYRLNISCSCKCLITGAVPSPLPTGKVAEDYHDSYPITGQTGESPNITYWKKSIAGGPFTDDAGAKPPGKTAQEKCDAFQVDGCCGTCGWYKIRKAFYDANCLSVNSGYNDTPTCVCRCLISGAVPDPIPTGKTAADYTGYYVSVDGAYQYTLFGPYEATCNKTADQVCADTHIEGCNYAWGCGWDDVVGLGKFLWKVHQWRFVNADCTGDVAYDFGYHILCCSGIPETFDFCKTTDGDSRPIGCSSTDDFNHFKVEIVSGPANRLCDL